MPTQPPVFGGGGSGIRKPWRRPPEQPDRRKRGRAGQRDRQQVLDDEPLCRECLKLGLTTPSAVVDHIVRLADGGSDERDNKQGLCKPCHDAKSAAEQALDAEARAAHRG